ncbi:MAG TPA: hypoxanthine phosphoribosyltransferase [Syntrophothermus lipocalidus]|nr:hypoxanthine phosphoribosyltransferase [Syntrophothermus lipocalidus]HOV42345.1 hypoxanthine phosphoribosyltransferase [Syntrophothermus lipocalidus]
MGASKVLLTKKQIQSRVRELGQSITYDYAGHELVVVGILTGSFIFLADLVRTIDVPVVIDFMSLSSYGALTESSGEVRILKDLEMPVEGKNVLVVEDIVDTGLTLTYVVEVLKKRRPQSLKVCVLLDKPSRRKTAFVPDYCGFVIPDEFVVGYGLDYAGKYRNLPDIRILELKKSKGQGGDE